MLPSPENDLLLKTSSTVWAFLARLTDQAGAAHEPHAAIEPLVTKNVEYAAQFLDREAVGACDAHSSLLAAERCGPAPDPGVFSARSAGSGSSGSPDESTVAQASAVFRRPHG